MFLDYLSSINIWAILSIIGVLLLRLLIILIAYSIVKSLGTKLIKKGFERAQENQNLSRGRAKTLEDRKSVV